MTASPSPSERTFRTVATAVLLGGVLGALLGLLVGDLARRTLFDTWQRAAPRPVAGGNVAVVLIDSLSFDAVGPWPWPRYYIARLTETIARDRPRAIGFDMIFAEPDALNPDTFASLYPELAGPAAAEVRALESMDGTFARVLGAAPVVLARLGIDRNGVDPAQLLIEEVVTGTPPRGLADHPQVLASIPELDDVALGHAVINGPPDSDGIVRKVPLAVTAKGRMMPGMALELARLAVGEETAAWRGGRLHLGGTVLPADGSGSLSLRFGAFPARETHSAAEVLAGKVPAGAFAGKVVLIGLGAEGSADVVATPQATEGFGVFVQAQAVDAILHRGWLARPAWVEIAEWAAGALLVLLVLAAGALRQRGFLFAALGLTLALPVMSWLAFTRANLLFDPLGAILVGLGAALALEIVSLVRARAERSRLAAALVDQQIASALQEGELQAARAIQLGMVPGDDRLAALDPRVDVGAVLRPARSVGGDFYDAIRIDAEHLLFVIGDVTGKGVPAALYMALSKALTRSVLTREAGSLAHTVATLNRELMRDADDAMGVSMLVVLLDCASGAVTMVNAGHENPIVLRADGAIETLAMDGGPPFCVVDFPYPEERQRLAPGDTVVLITDGVTEAQDAAGRLLGPDAAREALGRAPAAGAGGLARFLVDAVRRFEAGTEASDDLTILAIGYRGPRPN